MRSQFGIGTLWPPTMPGNMGFDERADERTFEPLTRFGRCHVELMPEVFRQALPLILLSIP